MSESDNQDPDFWDLIRVVNVRGEPDFQPTHAEKVVIVHRQNPVLGNPFPMTKDTLSERLRVIAAYKQHLDQDLERQGPMHESLLQLAKEMVEHRRKIALTCFCAPLKCHADHLVPVLVKMAQDLTQQHTNKSKPGP